MAGRLRRELNASLMLVASTEVHSKAVEREIKLLLTLAAKLREEAGEG